MSADLRTALRDAVADEPAFSVDAAAIADAGGRRARRRTGLAVAAAALSTTAVLAAVAVLSRPADPDPAPAPTEVVHLGLDSADEARLDVIASTRTTWRDDGSDEFFRHDRLEGLTADGLVLRNRRTGPSVGALLGLLDPRTGTTDWLPDPPANLYGMQPLALDVDRLVLGVGQGNGHSVLVFDRAARQWRREVVEVPYGLEVHVPPRLELHEDRVYVGSIMEGNPGPMRWWSAPVPDGGPADPEPDLEGAAATWGSGMRLTAHPDGRVVLTRAEGSTVVAEDLPAGCERPTDFPDAAPDVVLAGDVPVVTFPCEGSQVTMVYRPGEVPVAIRGVSALAGDDGHVVLATARTFLGALMIEPGTPARTYLLDLDDLSLGRVGMGPHEVDVALAAGMLLWNEPGPGDSKDAYDVVWKVARLD